MPNFFDQFDAPAASGEKKANFFDQFDAGGQAPVQGDGQAMSGLKRSFREVPGMLAGAAAFGADVVGATETRDSLLGYAKRKGEEVGALHQNDASSLTDAWDGKVGWLDFLANSAGYVTGQAIQSVLTGGVGALGAKMLAKAGVKEAGEAAAAKAIAEGASEEVAKAAAIKAISEAGATAAKAGAVTGAAAQNFGMELGSIYPEAVDQAEKEGRTLDSGDKMRVFAAASLAAGIDTAGEAIMASRVLRGSKVGAGEATAPKLFGSEIAARAAKEVPAGMLREGGTEAIQTGIERVGAGQEVFSPEGVRDIIDSAGVGAVGGGLGGAAASLHRRRQAEAAQKSDEALDRLASAGTIDELTQAFTDTHQPLVMPPLPAGLDAEGAMARMEQQSADDYKAAKVAARAPGYGDVPMPAIVPQSAADTAASATAVDTEPFLDRLLTIREQLQDSRVRQQVRDTLGPEALNDVLYYSQQADREHLPGKTSDNMLALAETILSRAQVQPLPRQKALAEKQAAKQAKLGMNAAPLQIPLDTTPTGSIRVDSQGQATPEIRADQVSLADRARAMQARRVDGMTGQTPRDQVRGAGPGVMVGEGALTTAAFPIAAPVETRLLPGQKDAPQTGGAEWQAFTPESGTKGIPRADMPQIEAAHRGAMVNFLAARGITHESVEVPAADLKPTQAEYSPAKVQKARDFSDTDRSILISSDGHILDGHHQWLAKIDGDQPVKAIRLDAPIAELLPVVREFPSATLAEGATTPTLAERAAAIKQRAEAPAAEPEGGATVAASLPLSSPVQAQLSSAQPVAQAQAAKPTLKERTEAMKPSPETIELMKQESVLRSILECLG